MITTQQKPGKEFQQAGEVGCEFKKLLHKQGGEQVIWAESCRTQFESEAGVNAFPSGPSFFWTKCCPQLSGGSTSCGASVSDSKKRQTQVMKIRIVMKSKSSRWELANFSCKGSDGKLMFCAPYSLYSNNSTAIRA